MKSESEAWRCYRAWKASHVTCMCMQVSLMPYALSRRALIAHRPALALFDFTLGGTHREMVCKMPREAPSAAESHQLTPEGPFTTVAPATFDNVALVSAALGILVGAGACVCHRAPCFGMYMVCTGVFHVVEFWITARFNAKNLGMASFLLANGVTYVVAYAFAAVECVMRWYFAVWPRRATAAVGLAMVVCGQLIRSIAMVQAAGSFSHYLQTRRQEGHVLMYHGLYGIVRHPSYTGYLLWAVGMQLMIGNVASAGVFAVCLTIFFALRIPEEERLLMQFFGEQYDAYRAFVWSGIPLIK